MMRITRGAFLAGTLAGGMILAAPSWLSPARAQTDATAEVQRTFANIFEGFERQLGRTARITTSRPIEVRQQGGAVVAVLPDLAIVGQGGGRLEIGTLNVTRREVNGRHRWETELPREMRMVEGRDGGVITIGSGPFAMEIDPRTQTVHDLQLDVRQIAIRPAAQPGSAQIDRLEVAATLNRGAEGLYEQPARLRISGFAFSDPRTATEVRIGGMGMTARTAGFRLEDYERFAAAVHAANDMQPPENIKAIAEAFFGFSFTSMNWEISAEGIQSTQRGQPVFALGQAALSAEIGNPTQPEMRAALRLSHRGLALGPNQIPYQGLVPSEMNVVVETDKLPTPVLRRFFSEGFLASRAGAPQLRPGAVEALAGAMLQSQATLRIQPFAYVSQMLGAMLTGTMNGNPQSPMGVVASGELVLRGLDQVLREFGMGPEAGRGNPMAGMAAMLSALGQQGTGPDGQPTRTYRFELNPQGQITLNGTDLSPMLGMLMGGGGRQGGRPPQSPPQRQPAPAPNQPAAPAAK